MFSIGECASFSKDNMTPDTPYVQPTPPPMTFNHYSGQQGQGTYATSQHGYAAPKQQVQTQKVPTLYGQTNQNPPYAPRDLFQNKEQTAIPNKRASLIEKQHLTAQEEDGLVEDETYQYVPPSNTHVADLPSSSTSPNKKEYMTNQSSNPKQAWHEKFFVISFVILILACIIMSWYAPIGSIYERRFRLFTNSLAIIALLMVIYGMFFYRSVNQ
jgi:hypothetical protein